jgi:hypothetical protein
LPRSVLRWAVAAGLSVSVGSAHAQTGPSQAASGSTIATAIVLPGVTDEFHGVVAEHAFIADHFPTWHIEYSARFKQNDHDYDVLGLIEPDKTKVPIFFDITEWKGK